MSYVEATRAPHERILLRATFNWTHSVGPAFWTILGALPLTYTAVHTLIEGAAPGNGAWVFGLSAVPAVLGIGILIAHFIGLVSTEIVVTSLRFVYKTGLVARRATEVSLSKIEEVSLHQSILGRIFGFGRLTLHGTGVGVIALPNLDNPVLLRRVIETARSALPDEMPGAVDATDMAAASHDASRDTMHQHASGPVRHAHRAEENANLRRKAGRAEQAARRRRQD